MRGLGLIVRLIMVTIKVISIPKNSELSPRSQVV